MKVVVDDENPGPYEPVEMEDDGDEFKALVKVADEASDWPSWEFGW